jgi:hypothetical protein
MSRWLTITFKDVRAQVQNVMHYGHTNVHIKAQLNTSWYGEMKEANEYTNAQRYLVRSRHEAFHSGWTLELFAVPHIPVFLPVATALAATSTHLLHAATHPSTLKITNLFLASLFYLGFKFFVRNWDMNTALNWENMHSSTPNFVLTPHC